MPGAAPPRAARVEPTSLDPERLALGELSDLAPRVGAYSQSVRDYAAKAAGFVGEIEGFLRDVGCPTAWRPVAQAAASPAGAAPAPAPAGPAPAAPAAAAAPRIEPIPVEVPPEYEHLLRRPARRAAAAEAKDALGAALGARLAKPLELWVELQAEAKARLPELERLRDAHDAARVRLEAAKMEVLAEESKAPLTLTPGTAQQQSAQEAAGAAAPATAPRALAQLQAGGALMPLPAVAQRAEMYRREAALTDATLAFELARQKARGF
ncbi:hypothetical protein Rsub_00777 [Raphidocelis subcapitata]|uniref:Uncharacterized protein n=1 Tax=Raphidocelis subcapitata TaxID=307507 RepID=A0A2V0NTA4_9CHLO|nr:hypothetical protein Rsub_00777 [Raphidocelis subcapitata]|eukprot:GBF88065.1 hypothetical protein Rsub_00777 [Raphidocelis subcapitata]